MENFLAATYKPSDAFTVVKAYLKNMPFDTVETQVLADVCSYMWMYSTWRWTIGTFPNITLVSSQQDYNITVPNDFLYLIDSLVTNQAGDIPINLYIEPYLASGGKQGTISRIALISGAPGGPGIIRFEPSPGTIPSGWTAISVYKKQAPKITAANQDKPGALIMDDEWMWVFNSGVLYYGYLYGDDQRAGGAQIDPRSGKVSFSGQRGIFEANLQLMASREKLLGSNETQTEKPEMS